MAKDCIVPEKDNNKEEEEDEEVALEDSCFMFALPDDSDEEDAAEEPSLSLKYDHYVRHSEPTDPRLALQTNTDESRVIKLSLIARHHSLWAEFVYNAARVVADLMDDSPFLSQDLPRIDVRDKRCLELGAGAGLPGIMCLLKGAREVVISDYGHDTDLSLVYPIDVNIDLVRDRLSPEQRAYAVGYVWGYPVEVLCDAAQYYQREEKVDTSSYAAYLRSKRNARITDLPSPPSEQLDKFDVVFLADLIFNRSQHEKLLWTVRHTLKADTGVCWVSFSHHDPQKRDLDLNFFELAKQDPFNFTVTFVGKEVRQTYPFREEDGMDAQRGVVYLYTLTLPSTVSNS